MRHQNAGIKFLIVNLPPIPSFQHHISLHCLDISELVSSSPANLMIIQHYYKVKCTSHNVQKFHPKDIMVAIKHQIIG